MSWDDCDDGYGRPERGHSLLGLIILTAGWGLVIWIVGWLVFWVVLPLLWRLIVGAALLTARLIAWVLTPVLAGIAWLVVLANRRLEQRRALRRWPHG